MAGVTALNAQELGVKKMPIHVGIEGKFRSIEIPGTTRILAIHLSGEIWCGLDCPVAPDRISPARPGSTFTDCDMRLGKSGKNGHYPAISWSN